MFRRLFIVAVIAFLPSLAAAQDRAAIAKAIETNERAINGAIQKGDLAGFKALVAEDGINVDGMGITGVPEFLKMFNQLKLETFAIDQVKVTFLNDSAAVITYRFTGKGSMMGMPMPSPVIASTAYATRGGKWVAVFHQETVPTPMPAAKK